MNKLIYTLLVVCFALFSANGQILINEYSAAKITMATLKIGLNCTIRTTAAKT